METILVGEVQLPHIEIPSMARDFGLDITVPDGGLVSSSANQKQYKAECGRIYREFLVNMADHLQEEEETKRDLRKMQGHKLKGSHIGGEETEDGEVSEAPSGMFSRSESRTRGFITNLNRPQTATGMLARRGSMAIYVPPNRPSTVAEYSKLTRETRRSSYPGRKPSVELPQDVPDFDGVMDHTSQNTRERKIKMNASSFSKLLTGQVNIKLQHKAGRYVLKQVEDNGKSTNKDMGRSGELTDKIALVRRKTSFRSPTLSSDLKVNNLVAIQKSLIGLPARRVSVGEIMDKAKNRRARLFKVEVSGAGDIQNGAIYNQPTNMADDVSVKGHDGVKMIKVEARKRRTSSPFAFSQDGGDMRAYRDMYHDCNTPVTPRTVRLNLDHQSVRAESGNVYMNTSVLDSSTSSELDCERVVTPRILTTRDAKSIVRRSVEEDKAREEQLNKWRQRMTFAAVKRNGLGRVLSGAGVKR